MVKLIKKISFILIFAASTFVFGQTPGFNYQALILSNDEIQVPGTDISNVKVPLSSENIILRFTITNEAGIEYIEEQNIFTDENGLVSVIVGDGESTEYNFKSINWDGKLKYLNVELNVLKDNDGFVFLDTQKILYVPHPSNGTSTTGNSTIRIVDSLKELTPPHNLGDLVWITKYGANNNPTLLIWDASNWLPVNDDFDTNNELGLVVVKDKADRKSRFDTPKLGDQVWNKNDKNIQVFDGTDWVSATNQVENGIYNDGINIKLGGSLIEPTKIITSKENTFALEGLQESQNPEDQLVVIDKNTGVLKQKSYNTLKTKQEKIIEAKEGQLEFSTPSIFTDSEKISVYRNGIRINFTAINNNTIKLEPEAICYEKDKIRIVQFF